jgi:DNA polymerase elongation subunit (family B)
MDGAAKIFINSIFGFCGAPGLNFNSPKVAAKITESTRDFLEKAMVWATGDGKDKWLT